MEPLTGIKQETEFIHLKNDNNFDNASLGSNLFVREEDRGIIEKQYLRNKDSFRLNNILRTLGPFGLNE